MKPSKMLTLSAAIEHIGAVGGPTRPAAAIVQRLHTNLQKAVSIGLLRDGLIAPVGPAVLVVVSHALGKKSHHVEQFLADCFASGKTIATEMGLYDSHRPCTGTRVEMEFGNDYRRYETVAVIASGLADGACLHEPLRTLLCDPNRHRPDTFQKTIREGLLLQFGEVRPRMLHLPNQVWDIHTALAHNAPEPLVAITTSQQPPQHVAAIASAPETTLALVRTEEEFPPLADLVSVLRAARKEALVSPSVSMLQSGNLCRDISCWAISLHQEGRFSKEVYAAPLS